MKVPFLDNIGVRFLASFYVALCLTILVHRLALAITARWLGFDVTSVGIGRARPLIVVRWGRTIWFVCTQGLTQGCEVSVLFPDSLSRSRLTAYWMGGLTGYVLLIAVGAVGYFLYPRWPVFWGTLAGLNLLCLLGATEWRFTWRLWRGSVEPPTSLPGIGTLHREHGLWQAIGDRRAEADALQAASEDWLMLGDVAHAHQLLREAEELQPEQSSDRMRRWHLRRGLILGTEGNYESAAAEYEAARQLCQQTDDVNEAVHVALQQAGSAAINNAPQVAEQLLEDMASHPAVLADPVLQVIAWRLELVVRGEQLPLERIEAIAADYAALSQRARLTPQIDWSMYRRLTFVHASRQDTARAQATFRHAAEAAKRIFHELPTEEDRQRFVACGKAFDRAVAELFQGDASPAWSQCVAELNAELQQEIDATEQAQREQAEKNHRRQRSRMRFAIAVLPLNALMFVATVWAAPSAIKLLSPDQDGVVGVLVLMGLWLFALLLFGLSVVGAVAYSIYYMVGGQFLKHARKGAADEYFRLAVLPWPALGCLGLAVVLIAWLR